VIRIAPRRRIPLVFGAGTYTAALVSWSMWSWSLESTTAFGSGGALFLSAVFYSWAGCAAGASLLLGGWPVALFATLFTLTGPVLILFAGVSAGIRIPPDPFGEVFLGQTMVGGFVGVVAGLITGSLIRRGNAIRRSVIRGASVGGVVTGCVLAVFDLAPHVIRESAFFIALIAAVPYTILGIALRGATPQNIDDTTSRSTEHV
jgi:hypothetical protein